MNVKIIGTGSYLPEKVLTNLELSGMVDTSDEWITQRTGIKERRISCGEANWQLALNASKKALEASNTNISEIDLIICATVTPDYFFPSMACILHNRLGARKGVVAFDVSAACSGFVYVMDIAKTYMEACKAKKALIVSSECLSKIVDYHDRRTCVLFGDGSGAAVLEATDENDSKIIDTYLIADGDGAETMLCRAVKKTTIFSKIKSAIKLGNKAQDKFTLSMDGQEVFRFAVTTVPKMINEIIERNHVLPQDVKFIIPHQANVRIIQSAVKKLGISDDKVILTLDKYGNTSSASVPICLDELARSGRLQKGDLIILIAFGAGYTAGGALIKW